MKRQNDIILFVTLLFLVACTEEVKSPSIDFPIDGINNLFVDIDEQRMPGCALGIIHNGEYVFKNGYGLANLEHSIPIDSSSMFRTGSLSKQFTAMAIAILSERGKLDLDADVHEYLPELIDYGYKVTVRQMIHHLAGMGDYDPDLFFIADGKPFDFGNKNFWTIQEFFDAVSQVALRMPPETKWQYSNLAYFLLAHVVERVSGMTLREFSDREIFTPLGMSKTFFNDNVNTPVENRVDGYKKINENSYEIYMTNLNFIGDGGVYTNIDDFIKWDRNFYDNQLDSASDNLISVTTTPFDFEARENKLFGESQYAFGHFVGSSHGQEVIGHTGGWVGFNTVYLRYPDLSLSIVNFCNSTDVSAANLGNEAAKISINWLTKK